MNNHKVDLGILSNGRLIRIQVKSASYDKVYKKFRPQLQTRDKEGKHINYKDMDIDFFIIQCAGLPEFYVVPAAFGIKKYSANLFPNREGLTSNILEWEDIVMPFIY